MHWIALAIPEHKAATESGVEHLLQASHNATLKRVALSLWPDRYELAVMTQSS